MSLFQLCIADLRRFVGHEEIVYVLVGTVEPLDGGGGNYAWSNCECVDDGESFVVPFGDVGSTGKGWKRLGGGGG